MRALGWACGVLAVSSSFCQQSTCPCGYCDAGNGDGYCHRNDLTNIPRSTDTGGTCSWLPCSDRGGRAAVRCDSSYKCVCQEGYFADSDPKRIRCKPLAELSCYSPGGACYAVQTTGVLQHCSSECKGLSTSDVASQYKDWAQDLQDAEEQDDSDSGALAKLADDDCANCLGLNGLYSAMIECTRCLTACGWVPEDAEKLKADWTGSVALGALASAALALAAVAVGKRRSVELDDSPLLG
mmetsp:Transcript_19843/g.50449  ORF Transcript_19843/g.50449 Transcript_19843/m.50449 type:complete len:240 (-) Transcript_19843:75-794(-)